MFIERTIENTVITTQNSFPVLLLTGLRQVGKTTLLKKIAGSERKYVTLDAPLVRELAVTEPELFLQRYSPPVLIDEIQYAPQLLPYIKMYVDEHRRNGDFWLTGSQMFHLMKNVSESLAGRTGVLNLLALSNSEICGQKHGAFVTDPTALLKRAGDSQPLALTAVFERIFRGGMPGLYTEPQLDCELFFSSYVQTYLQRDVKDLAQVGDEMAFLRFLTVIAARTGQILNYADVAKDVGISSPTAKKWLSILVSSGVVALVEPYFNNVLKRAIKTPKLYFLDTGLCAWLTKWTTAAALESGAMAGAIFETWVVSEIIKSYTNAGRRPPLYYYRDKDGREIDLLIHENNTLYPVEIKKSGAPGKTALKNFTALKDAGVNTGYGSVVCLCKDLLPIDAANWMVPAWVI